MSNGMAFFDEHGEPAATVAFSTLQALAPLTADPAATLAALGITDPAVKAALVKLAQLAQAKP
jgi:hypothetical protein